MCIRLLVLLFVEKSGVKDIALAFADISQQKKSSCEETEENATPMSVPYTVQVTKQVAQLLVSVPDRAKQHMSGKIRSPYPNHLLM